MPATGPARAALSTALSLLLGAVLLPLPSASASTAPLGGRGATVRIVVRTTGGGAPAVTRAAEAAGATRVGRIARLHSVSFEIGARRASGLRSTLSRRPDVTSVGVAHRRWFTDTPADPRFPEQRSYLDATGFPAAWDRGAVGGPATRIAIVDSGVDVTHPDLAGKVVGTYNAVTGGTDVHDVVGHGTGTASVAAAATNNGVGIAGAGRDSSLLAVKVADVTGRIFTDNLAAGIVWAVVHGATVVNLSLGGPTTDALEKSAVDFAEAHGVLVVAAAGNEGTSAKQYPGALPGVIAVGATNANGSVRAPFSSRGSWVDLAAPGTSIVVATPGGGYEVADGTSYSAPVVSGAAALLAAYRPGRTAAQLSQALIGGTDAGRFGFAHGLLHVDRSLDFLPPGTAATLTAPPAGSTVSGAVTVSATSSAARVRLTLGGLAQTVATSGGSASASFSTYGLGGDQTVTAADCSGADQCGDATSASGVVVDNGTPTFTAPAAGQDVRGDTLAVGADATGGTVAFWFDDDTAHAVSDGAAPYAVDLPTAGLADGPHTVHAVICDGGTVCDRPHTASLPVTVTRLHPAITKVSPRAISPDGDGRQDATTVTYRLDRRQTPTLLVRDAAGAVVYRKALGAQGPGTHTARWTGRTSGGSVVHDGDHTLQVATSDGTLQGLVSTVVRVDRTRPALRGLAVSAPRVLPVKDGYQDTVRMQARTTETLASLTLQVSTRSGAVVRTVRVGRRAAGTLSLAWDGRTPAHRLAAGTYRLRLVAQDLAGNRTTSAARTVTSSGQRLVKRSGSTTVTARASLRDTFTDDCSQVFRRSGGRHAGWVAYVASSTCTSGDAYAAGDHQVRLPAAVRYGTVRVSAFGASSDSRFRDTAKVVYYDSLENLSRTSFRLSPSAGTHTGPRVAATPLLIRSRAFRWMTLTTGVAGYDVRDYRVDFTYFVLR